MRKRALAVFILPVVLLVFSASLLANIRIGAMVDKSFTFKPFYPMLGVDFDIELMPSLWLDPEVYLIPQDFRPGSTWIAPGLLVNWTSGLNSRNQRIFLGGGITKWWLLGADAVSHPLTSTSLKLNLGLINYNAGLTVSLFVNTPFNSLFKDMAFGILIGFHRS